MGSPTLKRLTLFLFLPLWKRRKNLRQKEKNKQTKSGIQKTVPAHRKILEMFWRQSGPPSYKNTTRTT
jgi:hypothetical protein